LIYYEICLLINIYITKKILEISYRYTKLRTSNALNPIPVNPKNRINSLIDGANPAIIIPIPPI